MNQLYGKVTGASADDAAEKVIEVFREATSTLIESHLMKTSVLKPGRVNRVIRVTFCPGHPGLTHFMKPSGSDPD